MTLISTWKDPDGHMVRFEYEDADDFSMLDKSKCRQVYGVCFCDGKLVIGRGGRKGDWGLIGGTIEPGETFEETLKREVQEESNMEVLTAKPIGYQKAVDTRDGSWVYQLRYVCRVQPYGPFTGDPDGGSIQEIKLIDPADYRTYFDWGETGERMIHRSIESIERLSK
ncbi:MAG: NUDIX domain-containing protein [Patescibacteria group bacterium]|nr:NUDIX domain-containing protein [Patescibacteria group bacterium]